MLAVVLGVRETTRAARNQCDQNLPLLVCASKGFPTSKKPRGLRLAAVRLARLTGFVRPAQTRLAPASAYCPPANAKISSNVI